jgi:hypothetical protein
MRRVLLKAKRRALLRKHGWVRIGRSGSETWQHLRLGRRRFNRAAAYLAELEPAFVLRVGVRELLLHAEGLISYARRLLLEQELRLAGVLVGDGLEEPE